MPRIKLSQIVITFLFLFFSLLPINLESAQRLPHKQEHPRNFNNITVMPSFNGDSSSSNLINLPVLSGISSTLAPTNSPVPVPLSWPVNFSADPAGNITVTDLNNDGQNEVIFTDSVGGLRLNVHDQTGASLPGWPKHIPGLSSSPIASDTVIGDIDNDGIKEIFVNGRGFHFDGTSVAGWPKLPTGCSNSNFFIAVQMIADVNNDNSNDVIGIVHEGFSSGSCVPGAQIYIWDSSGNLFPNMPITMPLVSANSTGMIAIPALADLDGDHNMEIIIPRHYNNIYTGQIFWLMAYHVNGQPVNGWPVELFTEPPGFPSVYSYPFHIYSAVSTGDIDGNGMDEVAFIETSRDISTATISVLKGDGTYMPGFPLTITSTGNLPSWFLPYLSLGDINEDGILDIVAALENRSGSLALLEVKLFALNGADGTNLPGWPVSFPFSTQYYVSGLETLRASTPIILSKDSYNPGLCQPGLVGSSAAGCINYRPKVIFGVADYSSGGTNIHALEKDGSFVSGFPFFLSQEYAPTTPYLGDVDDNGVTDMGIITASSGSLPSMDYKVNFYDLPQLPNKQPLQWGTYGHDEGRTFRHVR